MQKKNRLFEFKEVSDEGSFEAVIATLGSVDSDGDVVEKGAFKGTAPVPILPSHDSSHVPIGKVFQITEKGNEVIAKGQFNMSVSAGADWFAAIKADIDTPPAVMEYSWGYVPTKFHFEDRDDEMVRVLEGLDLLEVSPVLRGASVGTRTLSAKQRQQKLEGMTDHDLRQLLQAALDEEHAGAYYSYVEAMTSEAFVYSRDSDTEPHKLFERTYVLSGDQVTLGDDPVEVIRETTYRQVSEAGKSSKRREMVCTMIDQIREAREQVKAALGRVNDLRLSRQSRGKKVSATVEDLAERLTEEATQLQETLTALAREAEGVDEAPVPAAGANGTGSNSTDESVPDENEPQDGTISAEQDDGEGGVATEDPVESDDAEDGVAPESEPAPSLARIRARFD